MGESFIAPKIRFPLRMRRILIVEDSGIIAAKLSRIVGEAGGLVVGPVARVASAISAIAAAGLIDGALLDVDLRGEPVYDVAEVLLARRVAFLFLTG